MDSNVGKDAINTKAFVKLLADRYIGDSGASRNNPLVSPLFATKEHLARLPPHWISVAGHDMLRDHGERMGKMINEAGGQAVVVVHEGQQHVMEFMAGEAPEADASIKDIGKWVRETVG